MCQAVGTGQARNPQLAVQVILGRLLEVSDCRTSLRKEESRMVSRFVFQSRCGRRGKTSHGSAESYDACSRVTLVGWSLLLSTCALMCHPAPSTQCVCMAHGGCDGMSQVRMTCEVQSTFLLAIPRVVRCGRKGTDAFCQ